MKYTDPDGRKVKKLTDSQWQIVKKNLDNLIFNLDYIIEQLIQCENDISKLDSKILNSIQKYLLSDFGTHLFDIQVLTDKLKLGRDHLKKLSRKDFKYDDKTSCFGYCRPIPLFFKIRLGNNFFNSSDAGTYDSKEGILFHEATHFIGWLWTADPAYDYDEMLTLPDTGFWNYKTHNANNWEYFYEELFL